MTTDMTNAIEIARETAEDGPGDRFLDRIAERIGGRASVKAVFGEPIERGDLTVVPVARVRWGFGGGSGSSESEDKASGSGGGGGVAADAIGYIEIRAGEATFRPILPTYPSPVFLLAAGLTGAIVIRALARLLRR
jgi:Sporulation protein YtfJ (Spore_YtfJ)